MLVGIGAALLHARLRRPPTSIPRPATSPALVGTAAAAAPHQDRRHDNYRHNRHGHDVGQPVAPHSHGLLSPTHPVPAQGSGTLALLATGFAGGLVPVPSALVVLLGGIALGRAWFGLVLVIAYELGMATALVLVGVALVKARDRVAAALEHPERPRHVVRAATIIKALPVLTAVLVIVTGLSLAGRALLLL